MRMIVRFKGKFKDLIPDGWTFQKLFARNYRQYHKTCDGSEYGQGCRIWQHHGGYLEIADLYDLSAVIVQQIKDGKIKEWESEVKSIFHKGMDKVYRFKIDEEKELFHPYHSPEYKAIQKAEWALADLPEGKKKEKSYDEYYNRYRSFNMRRELVTMLEDLVNRGLIDVEEDKTP